MTKNKLIGQTYVNIIKDENGQVRFAYGYEIDRDYNSAINILNKLAGQELSCVEKSVNTHLEQTGSMKQEATSFM